MHFYFDVEFWHDPVIIILGLNSISNLKVCCSLKQVEFEQSAVASLIARIQNVFNANRSEQNYSKLATQHSHSVYSNMSVS